MHVCSKKKLPVLPSGITSHVTATDMDRRKATLYENKAQILRKLIVQMSTFRQQINAEVPEAKSKSHDALAVSNASHTGASKLLLLTNTHQGKLQLLSRTEAQVFSCLTKSEPFYGWFFMDKLEPLISHRCASTSMPGYHVRQLI